MANSEKKRLTGYMNINLDEADELSGALGQITGNIKSGMNPQEATETDPQFLESLYAQAYHLYNTGKYEDAAHLFRALILMNSMEFKYMFGLAACQHLLKEYEEAIKIYTVCSILNPKDPLSYYHSSDCYIQQKDFLSALISLEMTLKIAGDQIEFARIKERALLSLDGVKEELKKIKAASQELSKNSQDLTEKN